MAVNHVWGKYYRKANYTTEYKERVVKSVFYGGDDWNTSALFIANDSIPSSNIRYYRSYATEGGLYKGQGYTSGLSGHLIFSSIPSGTIFSGYIGESLGAYILKNASSRHIPDRNGTFFFGTIYELKSEQTVSHYSQGSYIGDVKSTSRNAYPDNGEKGGYFYVYKGIDNQAPTISGSDLDLGSKTENFEVEYIVSDVDNDVVTVDIIVDTLKKVDAQSVRLGIKNTYLVNLADFSLGRHTIKIIAKDSKGSTTTRTYTFTKTNTAPTISGNDDNLGGKSTAFTVNYRVEDANNDDVSVTISLDDVEIGNVTSAQNKDLSVTIDSEKIQSLEIGTEHTITIKADDLKGGIAYRRYTFTKTNTAPIISGNNENLGSKTETFVQTFSITDIEKDKIYYQVFLDNVKVHEDLEVVDAKEYSYKIPHDEFIKLKYGTHTIKIVAWDDFNLDSKQERVYTFERIANGLEVEIKINEFTIKPKKVIAVPHGIFADDCTKTVEVCNNYLDDVPAWEDATAESKSARAYAFKNMTKTNEKWAIGVRIKITNGSSGVGSVLRGMKGGYE